MRACDPTLAAILADGTIPLAKADLFDITLLNGAVYRWTDYGEDLSWNSVTYSSQGPYMGRSKWNVTNTMEIPELELYLRATDAAFAGGVDIQSQIHNGLFDGASVLFNRLYIRIDTKVSLGTILLFGGAVSTVEIGGIKTTLKVKGANNKLNQYAPRNVYQAQCLHAFCDSGCTLLRSSFTSSFTVGSGATRTFVPWTAAPSSPTLFNLGTLTMTSGNATGQARTIDSAGSSGVTLSYPLYDVPAPGDTFTAFQGCDKTLSTCQSRSNSQNWRGFPFVPPASTGI